MSLYSVRQSVHQIFTIKSTNFDVYLYTSQLNSDLYINTFRSIFTPAGDFYENGGFLIKVKNCYLITYHIGQGSTILQENEWNHIGTISVKSSGNTYASCVMSSAGTFMGSCQIWIDADGKMYIRSTKPVNYVIIDGMFLIYSP